jgi:hypothetical protein
MKGVFYQFVDVMPSEQGCGSADDWILYTSVAFGGEIEKLYGISEYKDSSKRKRRDTSQLICNLLDSDEIWIKPFCVACRSRNAESNGKLILSETIDFQTERGDALIYEFENGIRFNAKRAKMYANYAFVLSCFGTNLSNNARLFNYKKAYLVLDTLPGDQPVGEYQPGLCMLQNITKNYEMLNKNWHKQAEINELETLGFCYASSTNRIGFIISDWVAQSIHAAVNRETFIGNVRRNGEVRRQGVAKILFSIFNQYKKLGYDPNLIINPMSLMSGL